MFLKAGVLSLGLLLASRLLGLLRETAQAAAFGTSGLADVAVLMLSLPDWLTGVAVSGALAYVLVPAWAGRTPGQVDHLQRRVAVALGFGGALAATAGVILCDPLARWLAGGLQGSMAQAAAEGLVWSAAALPLALMAALWGTRLQHERDFLGLYASNLVVNLLMIGAIAFAGVSLGASAATTAPGPAVFALGGGLLVAMAARLVWQAWRLPRKAGHDGSMPLAVPGPGPWAWAILSAGLPLALPFLARSLASQQGQGALATFSYAWKLVELPLMLAIQLVATLAFPAVARAVTQGLDDAQARAPVRLAFFLAFSLACACAAGLMVGAGGLAQVLFGWGRMDPLDLERVAQWGQVAALGLLPQAVAAVALTVLASQARLRPAALLYALALLTLAGAAMKGPADGALLMAWLNAVFAFVAIGLLVALGPQATRCLPWMAMAWPLGAMLLVAAAARAAGGTSGLPAATQLALAVVSGLGVLAFAWAGAGPMRQALRR